MSKILREVSPGVWNYKRYEARAKLKSIKYWQTVIANPGLMKKPMAYYVNMMGRWPQDKIDRLNIIAGYEVKLN